MFNSIYTDSSLSIAKELILKGKVISSPDFQMEPEIRNIALMRKIDSMVEFKQIVGRGTRLFDDKDYFTLFDFVRVPVSNLSSANACANCSFADI